MDIGLGFLNKYAFPLLSSPGISYSLTLSTSIGLLTCLHTTTVPKTF